MKKSFLFAFGLIVAFLVCSLTASAYGGYPHTCMISTGIGKVMMPDTDCDGIINIEDNCPYITNPAQKDSDMNGLGDACDVYIESINTGPAGYVYNGRAFNTIVTLQNYRDYNIRNMKVRVIVPELGIESVQYIDNINVCESRTLEFFLRAPMCVPLSDYAIIVETSFLNIYGDEEVVPGITSIQVVPDSYCQSVLSNGGVIGNTMIDVMEIQDAYKGHEAVFPIKIANMESTDKEYVFSVTGLDGWATSRLSPGSLIIVPSESADSVNLFIKPEENIMPGERVFVVSVQSGKEVQRFLLIANVKENPQPNYMIFWMFTFRIFLILLIVALILIALIIAARKVVSKVKSDPETQYY